MDPAAWALFGPAAGGCCHAWRRRELLREHGARLGTQIGELTARLAAEQQRQGSELERLQRAVAEDGEVVAKLEQQIAQVEARLEALRPALGSVFARLAHGLLQGQQPGTGFATLEDEAKHLEKELPRLEGQVGAQRTKLANHAAELRRVAAPLDSLRFAVERLTADRDRVTAEIAELEATLDRALWAVAQGTTLPVLGARLAALPAPLAAAAQGPLLRLRQVLRELAIGEAMAPAGVVTPPPREPQAVLAAAVDEGGEARYRDYTETMRVEGSGTVPVRRSRRVRRGGEWRTERYWADVAVVFYGPVMAAYRVIWERFQPGPLGQALAALWGEAAAQAQGQALAAWRREHVEPLAAEAARLTSELRQALGAA